MERAYYSSSASAFAVTDPVLVLGHLTEHLPFAVDTAQRAAWQTEIEQLQSLSPFAPGSSPVP
jgi:hypothetical protein